MLFAATIPPTYFVSFSKMDMDVLDMCGKYTYSFFLLQLYIYELRREMLGRDLALVRLDQEVGDDGEFVGPFNLSGAA